MKVEIARLKEALERVEARVAVLEQPAPAGTTAGGRLRARLLPISPRRRRATSASARWRATVGQRETVRGEVLAAARVDNVPIDPDMRGFVQLPGTDTVMRIGGYAKLDAIYDLKPAGDPDLFLPSSIPTGPTLGLNSFKLHTRQTRINLDLRRPVASDDLRIFVESDFFGLKPNLFRLRHAYGHWRNLLVGQSFSTFMDPDALVDTLDFEGPNKAVFVLQPQVLTPCRSPGARAWLSRSRNPRPRSVRSRS